MSDSNMRPGPEEPHDDKFENEVDHDNIASMLGEIEHHPEAFSMLKDAMRLDLSDKEFFDHVKKNSQKPTVRGKSLDDDWDYFKGNFGSSEEGTTTS